MLQRSGRGPDPWSVIKKLFQPDLAYRRLKIGIEYDGQHHRTDNVQWQRDVRRRDRYGEAGWQLTMSGEG
ncbi:hypothetical protein GCM10027344_03190 [Spelaeicoccus albus]